MKKHNEASSEEHAGLQSSVNSHQKQNMLSNHQKTHKCSELHHSLSHNVVNIQQAKHKNSKL